LINEEDQVLRTATMCLREKAMREFLACKPTTHTIERGSFSIRGKVFG
jgi:hypothetical protein